MIQFTQGFWSIFVFWFVVISVVATIGFTVVVIIGGFSDLRYLFRALDEQQVDETDDGRVVAQAPSESERTPPKSDIAA
jgi:hypothetical protein